MDRLLFQSTAHSNRQKNVKAAPSRAVISGGSGRGGAEWPTTAAAIDYERMTQLEPMIMVSLTAGFQSMDPSIESVNVSHRSG